MLALTSKAEDSSLEQENERLREDIRVARETNETLRSTLGALQSVVESLKSELSAQREAFKDQKEALEQALEKLDHLQKRFLGKKKSEKKNKVPSPESHERAKGKNDTDASKTKKKRRDTGKKRAEFETKRLCHSVPEQERTCPKCGRCDLKTLGGGRITKRWEYVPGHFICHEDVQEKLSCACGEYVVTAPPPPRPFENCRYGPRFISYLIVSKLWDSFPVHRLEKKFERLGIPMARSTMNELIHRMAEEFEPLIELMIRLIAASPVVLADETSIKIQDREKRGFVWTFVTPQVVLYRLTADRSAKHPRMCWAGLKVFCSLMATPATTK